jgi:hypothetical protein
MDQEELTNKRGSLERRRFSLFEILDRPGGELDYWRGKDLRQDDVSQFREGLHLLKADVPD